VPGLLLLLGLTLAGPANPSGAAENKAGPALVIVNDNLAPVERVDFYHIAEGSEIIPADWLGALVSVKTGKRLVEDLGRFGLLEDQGPNAPELDYGSGKVRLPVGLTLAAPQRLAADVLGQVVGVNCASCHTAEMTYTPAGKPRVAVRVDGGPGRFDVEGFYQDVFQSVGATVMKNEAFAAFLKRLDENKDKSKLSRLLVKLLPHLQGGAAADGDLAKAVIDRVRGLLAGGGQADDVASLYRALLTAPAEKRPGLVKSLLEKQRALKGLGAQTLLARLAVKKTPADGGLKAALGGVAVEELALLEARLVFLKRLRELHAPGVPQYPPGPGRVDAFVTARNLLFDKEFNIPASSPVRFPALWVLGPTLDPKLWLHWDGNTNSVMERNIGQALGLGAVANPDPRNPWSTIRPRNLHKLELYARKLKAPRWPEAFGAVDRNSKEYRDGKALYASICARCHDAKAGEVPREGKVVLNGGVVFPLDAIGTDPERANNFAVKLGKDSFVVKLGEVLRAIRNQAYEDAKVPPADRAKMDLLDKDVNWLTTKGYVARPLAGVWARAPYLHNGSVPTLDDLLKPAAKRPWVFPVGHSEYDPVKVGYVSDFAAVPPEQRASVFFFDTRKKGNSNAGHEGKDYGTGLDDGQQKALLSYLKTLGE
jgi:mono/diheme cytochrome c family protein